MWIAAQNIEHSTRTPSFFDQFCVNVQLLGVTLELPGRLLECATLQTYEKYRHDDTMCAPKHVCEVQATTNNKKHIFEHSYFSFSFIIFEMFQADCPFFEFIYNFRFCIFLFCIC